MRKHSAAESAHESSAPTEKKHRASHKKESKVDAAPDISTADRFMADTKEYMRLKERHAKLTKEIDVAHKAGLTLSAAERNMSQEDLPELEAAMASIAEKYGPMADRFKEDAEQVHVAEQAAKKLEDKKEKAILRSQISDIAAKFVRGDEKPTIPPAPSHAKKPVSRKTFAKPKSDAPAVDTSASNAAHPDDVARNEAAKLELSQMTDLDIQHAVNKLDPETFTAATERTIGTGEAEHDSTASLLNEMRAESPDVYTGPAHSPETRLATESETTASAISEIMGEIEKIPEETESTPDLDFTKDHFTLPPPPTKESWTSTEIRRAGEEIEQGTIESLKADLSAAERRVKGKFGVDVADIIANEKKGFWSRIAQRAKLFMDPELGDAVKEYRMAKKALDDAEIR